jgi:peptidyl-dipeptidase Dcp
MTSYRSAYADERGREVRPVVSLVGNFSKPTAEAPALLTFNEVLTLFHEFGHGLHGMLGRGAYASLTGTSVRWDFVELPSQIMENWCYEPAELAQWARHYATGEAMPTDLVERLAQSQTFLEGLATLRQLGFGLLDMAWHGARTAPTDLEALEREAFSTVDVWPAVDQSFISPSFSHIFAGGYSAGYYSYKWAEVLDADAYGYFREAPDQAAPRFRTLLESGGTVDPMDLYVAFRGRQPQPEALLRRAGLLNPTA